MARQAWDISDEFWAVVKPLLPARERRLRYPGRKRLSDRAALQGIIFVLVMGIPWKALPTELGFGSGSTCWRRLVEWGSGQRCTPSCLSSCGLRISSTGIVCASTPVTSRRKKGRHDATPAAAMTTRSTAAD